MRPALPVIAAGTLAAAALLVPTAASADTQSPWLSQHGRSQAQKRVVVDPSSDITWTVKNHKITVLTPEKVVVPFVYTCGDAANARDVQYNPGVFQDIYTEARTSAFGGDPASFPTFTCDGASHTLDATVELFPGNQDGSPSKGFENGTVEVGLYRLDSASVPRFEHALVGTNKVRDKRAKVAISVNAYPETTQPGAKITVAGTVKRDGKAYKGKAATLYFQNVDGSPAVRVGKATVSSKGTLSTKVTVTGAGTYFWTTSSTSKTQKGGTYGDFAASVQN